MSLTHSVAPTFMVAPHVEAGRLQQVLADWRTAILPVHVVYPPNRHISNRVRVFVEWVAELLASVGFTRHRPLAKAKPPVAVMCEPS